MVTSDLSRARHTAELVAGALGVPVALIDPDLREQRFGRFEGLTPRECEERYRDEWARYVADPHAGPPGGESRAALLERVVRALLGALPAGPGAPASGAPARIPNGGVVRVSVAAGQPIAARWLEL